MMDADSGGRALGLISFIVRIVVISLVVGLALSWLGIDPRAILRGGWDAILAAPRAAVDAAAWTIPYILTGAVVVVPVAAVVLLARMLGARARRQDRSDEPPPA